MERFSATRRANKENTLKKKLYTYINHISTLIYVFNLCFVPYCCFNDSRALLSAVVLAPTWNKLSQKVRQDPAGATGQWRPQKSYQASLYTELTARFKL